MASKTLVVAALLLAGMAASASAHSAQAPKLLGLGQLLINGTVHCSTGISTGATTVFPSKIDVFHSSTLRCLSVLMKFYCKQQLQMLQCSYNVGITWSQPRLQTLTECSACPWASLLRSCRLCSITASLWSPLLSPPAMLRFRPPDSLNRHCSCSAAGVFLV